MKKLVALLLAISITCAFAGCSEDSSDTGAKTSSSASSSLSESSNTEESKTEESKKEETTTTTTTAQETTTTKETTAEQTTSSEKETTKQGGSGIKFEDSYTYKFQQQSASSAFAMNMSMKYMGVEMPIEFQKNGNDFHLKMSASMGQVSYVQEYYVVGGKTYILDPSKKTYSETQGTNAGISGVTTLVPEGTFEVLSSKEENGQIVEVVKVKQKSASGKESTTDATYYYDKATGAPKKIDVKSSTTSTSVNITKFEVGAQTIKLPDLTGWTKKNSSTVIPM